MTTLYLRKQWYLSTNETGSCLLTSEAFQQEFPASYHEVLSKLRDGLDSSALSDLHFTQVEDLNSRGFIAISDHPWAPAWELAGAHYQTLHEQFKHVTFNILFNEGWVDPHRIEERLKNSLTAGGLTWDPVNPRITLLVSDTYNDLPVYEGIALPVILGRMHAWLGPLMTPERSSPADITRANPKYLPEVNYDLPPPYVDLQLAWVTVSILQFLGKIDVTFVSHFVDFNMGTMETTKWPVAL